MKTFLVATTFALLGAFTVQAVPAAASDVQEVAKREPEALAEPLAEPEAEDDGDVELGDGDDDEDDDIVFLNKRDDSDGELEDEGNDITEGEGDDSEDGGLKKREPQPEEAAVPEVTDADESPEGGEDGGDPDDPTEEDSDELEVEMADDASLEKREASEDDLPEDLDADFGDETDEEE